MNKIITYIIVVGIITSCSTYNSAPTKTPNNYSLKSQSLIPAFRFYHFNDDSTSLYFKINSSELLYTRPSENAEFTANMKLHYEIIDQNFVKTVVDSSSIDLSDINKNQTRKNIIGKIDLPLLSGKNYYITVTLIDKNRKSDFSKRFIVDKTNSVSRENFLPLKNITEVPLFTDFNNSIDSVHIRSERNANKTFDIRFYENDFGLPPPPFAKSARKPFSYENATVSKIIFNNSGHSSFYQDAIGMYHIVDEISGKTGYTNFLYQNGYPAINQTEHLLEPLRFLTTKQEYISINESKDLKVEIDKFWIECGGSSERAKNLIKHYYTRVKEANHFFTSYIEGYKTDRGLIHIIYGAPRHIYTNPNSETWIYGEESNSMSLTFTFTRVLNPFTNNDFSLNRNEGFKGSWYRAVDSWRLGRIYGQ